MTTATNQAGQAAEGMDLAERNEPIVANWMQDGKLCAAPSYEQLAAEYRRQREVIAALTATVGDFILDHDNELGPSVDRLRAALAKAGEGAV